MTNEELTKKYPLPDDSISQVNELISALVEAKKHLQNPRRNKTVSVRTKTGGTYDFSYTTLDVVLSSTTKILAEHGLVITQQIEGIVGVGRDGCKDAASYLETKLWHTSGQSISSSVPLVIEGQGAQAFASAVTYMRRYAICSLLGIAPDDDDDGNAASGNQATVKNVYDPMKPIAPKVPPQLAKKAQPTETAPAEVPLYVTESGTVDWVRWGKELAVKLQASTGKRTAELLALNAVSLKKCEEASLKIYQRIIEISQERVKGNNNG